jgi:hypothetical protein
MKPTPKRVLARRAAAIVAAAGVLACAAAIAQDGGAMHDRALARDALAEIDTAAAPPVVEQGRIRYMTGGIGLSERAAMQRVARDYPLRLSFSAASGGQYVAGVSVSIVDARGIEMLSVADAGPWLFVALPPGEYSIRATLDGRMQTQRASVVAGRPVTAILQWRGTRVD